MPIIYSNESCDHSAIKRLEDFGVNVIEQQEAEAQDIRPLKIGLLNLMPAPAMEKTEEQWLRWIGSQALLQIEPHFIKFDNDKRGSHGSSRYQILKRYKEFSEVAKVGLDGLIITGDNLELKKHTGFASRKPLPFEDIAYYEQLCEIVEWADTNVVSTIYSCLASHFALNHFSDIPRKIGNSKIFGVYEHELSPGIKSPFIKGMDDIIISPHSRWGYSDIHEILDSKDLELLAANQQIGWLAVSRSNAIGNLDLLLQGHPEYGKYDLHQEFMRDNSDDYPMPENYYSGNIPDENKITMRWSNTARCLHENWIGYIYNLISKP